MAHWGAGQITDAVDQKVYTDGGLTTLPEPQCIARLYLSQAAETISEFSNQRKSENAVLYPKMGSQQVPQQSIDAGAGKENYYDRQRNTFTKTGTGYPA
jgi:hypothetical protein